MAVYLPLLKEILIFLKSLRICIPIDRLGTDSLQFGFKSGTSTTQRSWLVMEVANHFLRNGTPCIVTLLDCTKAFDLCKFSILFERILETGVPPIVSVSDVHVPGPA